MDIKLLFSATLVLCCIQFLAEAEPVQDKQALLDFISNNSKNLNWSPNTSACSSWYGVTCNHDNSRIVALQLSDIGFRGSIPTNTLGRISSLEILNLKSNGINGSFPSELLKLWSLSVIDLQFNSFHGPLPEDFTIWKNLSTLNLSNNEFNGSFPSSVMKLSRLAILDVSHNSLSGIIPDLEIPSLQELNISYNSFQGVVPESFLRFPRSAFIGNNVSFENQNMISPSPPPQLIHESISSSFKVSEITILGIIGGCIFMGLFSIFLVLIFKKRGRSEWGDYKMKMTLIRKVRSIKRSAPDHHRGGSGRITFFEGLPLCIDLEDLLRASAEVLGKGCFATTYKASLEDGTIVAVKRLKEIIVGRKEFEQQMEILGNIRHENVSQLRAYYLSEEEKLLVYDYNELGSVSELLHGKEKIPLDWETRLNIAIGAAKGISHIHTQGDGSLFHGNIKASNIFLNSQHYGCISDIGIAQLIAKPSMRPRRPGAGYLAPEITDIRKGSHASDVYSLGVFLLELVTGKSPGGDEEGIELVRWVSSVVREEWTGEVFDSELLMYGDIEEEMVGMLQVGLCCVTTMPEERPKMVEVVKMIEDIRGYDSNSLTGTRSSPCSTQFVDHQV